MVIVTTVIATFNETSTISKQFNKLSGRAPVRGDEMNSREHRRDRVSETLLLCDVTLSFFFLFLRMAKW